MAFQVLRYIGKGQPSQIAVHKVKDLSKAIGNHVMICRKRESIWNDTELSILLSIVNGKAVSFNCKAVSRIQHRIMNSLPIDPTKRYNHHSSSILVQLDTLVYLCLADNPSPVGSGLHNFSGKFHDIIRELLTFVPPTLPTTLP